MTQQEQQLIQAIKAKPGYQVFVYVDRRVATVARTQPNRVSQQSVWLGRPITISRLQQILEA